MKLYMLASGSSGNCSLITENQTGILVDAGIGPRTLAARLKKLGAENRPITHILLTHAHSDHISGLEAIAVRTGAAVICSFETQLQLSHLCVDFLTFVPGERFRLGDIFISSFPVSHDCAGTCGFVFEGSKKLGYFTDSGCVTPGMERALLGCPNLVAESNHDSEMLRLGPYPPYLKARVRSATGHLSNKDCADFLSRMELSGCKNIVLAHLSRQNNNPETALKAAAVRLRPETRVTAASHNIPSEIELI